MESSEKRIETRYTENVFIASGSATLRDLLTYTIDAKAKDSLLGNAEIVLKEIQPLCYANEGHTNILIQINQRTILSALTETDENREVR